MDSYWLHKIHAIAVLLLVVGGLNWGLVGAFKFDLVATLFGKKLLARTVYILVGLSALFVAFNRDTYLPFLGPMVAPCSVLADRTPPGATREVQVTVNPGAKVLYWAAEPASEHLKQISSWKKAYGDYENAGVTTANSDGVATLKVREPQPYAVPHKGRLEPHVHFRVCGDSGWMGRIKTVYLADGHVEGFTN